MNTVEAARKRHWRKQLDFIVEYGLDCLSEWEQGLIDDLSIRFEGQEVELSFKQSSMLGRIYKKVEDKLG